MLQHQEGEEHGQEQSESEADANSPMKKPAYLVEDGVVPDQLYNNFMNLPKQMDEKENNNVSNSHAQDIIDRSAQRIRDLTELMGGSNHFNTSMHMFGKETEGFDMEESEFE